MDSSMRRRGDGLPTLEGMTPEQLKEYIENTHTEVVAATILSLLKELSDRERENDGLKKELKDMGLQNETLLKIINKIPAYLSLKSVDGSYILVNNGLLDFIGQDMNTILGRDAHKFFPTSFGEQIDMCDAQVVLDALPKTCRIDHNDKSGKTKSLLFIKVPLFDDKGNVTHILGIGIDNTETAAKQRGQESLMSVVRHEMRSPLAGLQTLFESLQEELDAIGDVPIDELTKVIKKLIGIIDEQDDFIQLEEGNYRLNIEEVNLFDIFREIEMLFSYAMKSRNLVVNYFYDNADISLDTELKLYSDKKLLYHLYFNIIKNAIEAAPDGTVINLEILNGGYSARVTNQGEIPKEIQPTFFEKYITSGKEGGTGIGTYLSHLITESLGGKISFTSDQDSGTTIYIDIPMRDEDTITQNNLLSSQKILFAQRVNGGQSDNNLSSSLNRVYNIKDGDSNLTRVNSREEIMKQIEQKGIGYFDIIIIDVYLEDKNVSELVEFFEKRDFKGLVFLHGKKSMAYLPDDIKRLGKGYIQNTAKSVDILQFLINNINDMAINKMLESSTDIDLDIKKFGALLKLNDGDLINFLVKIVLKAQDDYEKSLILLHRIHEFLESHGEEIKIFIVKVYIYVMIFRLGIGSLACKYQEPYIKEFYDHYNVLKSKGMISLNAQTKLERIFAYMFYWLSDQKTGNDILDTLSGENFSNSESKIRTQLNKNLYTLLFEVSNGCFQYIKLLFDHIESKGITQDAGKSAKELTVSIKDMMEGQIVYLKSILLMIKNFFREIKIEEGEKLFGYTELPTDIFSSLDGDFANKELLRKLIDSSKFIAENYKSIQFSAREKRGVVTIILDIYLLNVFLLAFSNKLLKKVKKFCCFLNSEGKCDLDTISKSIEEFMSLMSDINMENIEKGTLEHNYLRKILQSITSENQEGMNYFYELMESVIDIQSGDLENINVSSIVSEYILKNMHSSPAGTLSYYLSQRLYDRYFDLIHLDTNIKMYLQVLEKVDIFYSPGHNKRVDMITQYMLNKALENEEFTSRYGDDIEKVKRFLNMFDSEEDKDKYTLAVIHDIGKIGTMRVILGKLGMLSSDEYANLKTHSNIGITILRRLLKGYADHAESDSELYRDIREIGMDVFLHHERHNGSGYPKGLSGNDIPIVSQVLAIADCLEAMLGKRVYDRRNMTIPAAIKDIMDKSGKWYDPDLLQIIFDDTCLLSFLEKLYAAYTS